MLEVTSAKLTGVPGPSGWAQVHDFESDDPKKKEMRGRLFAVIATSRVQDADLDTIATGRELIARLHESYYGDTSLKPFNALKLSLEKVAKEFGESWGDVEIAACSVVNDIVYSACVGGGEVTISRKGILGTILKSKDSSVIQASGFPQEGDVILLATKKFYESMPQGIIKAALESGTPEQAIEYFMPKIQGEGGDVAAMVIEFVKEQPKMETAVLPVSGSGKTSKVITDVKLSMIDFLSKLTKKLPQKPIYVRPQMDEEIYSQSKKMTFSVAVILLVILGVSILFGLRQKGVKDVRGKYQSLLTSASQDVDEAITLASISPERSRELFYESEQKLVEIEAMNVKDSKVSDLRKKIDDSRAQVLGEYSADAEMFFDLSLLASGFKSDGLVFSGGSAYIMDKTGRRIVSIELASKKSKVAAGPNVIDDMRDFAAYEGRVFILSGDGIYEIEGSKSKVVESNWSGEVFIRAFAGNLYVLDKSANIIYRYQGQGSSFGSGQNWLASGTNADFTNAKAWIIDGSVYVLYPNSEIDKFSLGSSQSFSLKGVFPEIGNVDSIFTSDETEFIYVLDNAGKRVVVTDKKGVYKAQYKNEIIANAGSVVVSEKEKKILISVGDKLYSIDIKHF